MKIVKFIPLTALAFISLGCQNTEHPAVELQSNSLQNTVDEIADTLAVTYTVTHNRWDETCALPDGSAQVETGPCYEGMLTLSSPVDITATDWEIYYSQVEPIFAAQSDAFSIERVNGDLHRISPTENFSGFTKGESQVIHLVASGQVLTEAKLMPNYYVVGDNTKPRTIKSTQLKTDPETGLIVRPYVTPFTDTDNLFRKSVNDKTPLADANYLYQINDQMVSAPPKGVTNGIIPTPKHVTYGADGESLDISGGYQLNLKNIDIQDVQTALMRMNTFGLRENESGFPLNLSIENETGQPAESYSLDITTSGIQITGSDAAGVYYGLSSLAALMEIGDTKIATQSIVDAPRYTFRGMHIDVARNFHSLSEVVKVMDQMAAYKLNTLHLHLADDEGWRLEIPGLPELTDVGSKRCHDPKENTCLLMQLGSGPDATTDVNGYYSVSEYTELLQAANARHIQVIPSLDMPGHARAAVKSMEARYRKYEELGESEKARQYLLSDPNDASEYQSIQFYSDNTINPCMESSYVFLEKMIDAVAKIHRDADHPLTTYHIGADETAGAWTASPMCEAFFNTNTAGITSPKQLGTYFIERMSRILEKRNITTAAWNDGLDHADPTKLPPNVQSNIWTLLPSGATHITNKHANYGWDVVLSYPDVLYFDFPYEADPKEGGYYWATRHTNTRQVFDFMPDNPPIHAEFWKDSNENTYEIDDRLETQDGKIVHAPLGPDMSIKGIQGHIWSETVPTSGELEYRVFPRFLALAERAWHKADWEIPYNYDGAKFGPTTEYFSREMVNKRQTDWNRFSAIAGTKEFEKLDAAGVQYRIPTVGARIEDGRLNVNIAFPGLAIEYRHVGEDWQPYTKNVAVTAPIDIRARSADGTRAGRSLTVK